VPARFGNAGYTRADWTRIGVTVGGTAAACVGINLFMNRETREALEPLERAHLNSSFKWLGGGLAIITATAIGLHRSGASVRIMRANPWLVMGGSLVCSIGSMVAVFNTPVDSPMHTLAWTTFQVSQAAVLSPLLFLSPALLGRAALLTAGMMGSLCYVGATAKSDKFLMMGGPLTAGLVVVALSSLAPMVLPATALGSLAVAEALSLYGGLALFGGWTLYDCQKILAHARQSRVTGQRLDPAGESISLILDFINIFVRMVTILSGSRRR